MDGIKPESEARQKQGIKKAVKERAFVMSNVKMLMLVQRRISIRFNLKCFNADSKKFFPWLEKGKNNIDFLVEKRLVPYCADRTYHQISKWFEWK
jgi:hypothetical protein